MTQSQKSSTVEDTQKLQQNAGKRMLLNIFSNIAVIILNSAVSIMLAPYLVAQLGVPAYGVIVLASSLPAYLRLATASISLTGLRFISIAIGRDEPREADLYFNTTSKLLLVLSVLLLPVAATVSWLTPYIFSIPEELHHGSRVLFALILVAGLFGANANTLQLGLDATHRFYIRNIVWILARLTAVGTLLFTFNQFGVKLEYMGVYYLTFSVLGLIALFIVGRIVTPKLSLKRRVHDFAKIREIASMASWTSVNEIASLLYLAAGYIVVNRTMGSEATAFLGPTMMITSLIIMLSGSIGNVLAPLLYKWGGEGEAQRALPTRLPQSVRIMIAILGVPIVVVCALPIDTLNIWMGPDFAAHWLVLVLITAATWFGIASVPITLALRGRGHVATPALINSLLATGHIIASALLLSQDNAELWLFGLSYLIAFVIKTVVINLAYASHKLSVDAWSIVTPLIRSGLITVFLSLLSFACLKSVNIDSLASLAFVGASIAIIYTALTWCICLNREDRELIRSIIGRSTQR